MSKILKPFTYFSEKQLILVGLVAHFLCSYLAYLQGGSFFSLVSYQRAAEEFSFPSILYQNSVHVILAILIYFVVGKIIYSKTRFIDIVATVLVARTAFYGIILVTMLPFITKTLADIENAVEAKDYIAIQDATTMVVMMLFTVAALAFMALMFYYMYQGFKTATNSKTTKRLLVFIMTTIVLVMITTLVFQLIPYRI